MATTNPTATPRGPDQIVEGRVTVLAVDDPRGVSDRVYFVTGAQGAVQMTFPQDAPRPGEMVRVTGPAAGSLVVARQWQALKSFAAAAVGNAATGEQKVAIVLVSLPGIPLLTAATPALLQSTYFGPGPSVDAFLRESSSGKTWATGQVFGPVVLDADYIGQPIAIRDAAIRAVSGLVNFQNFNRLVLVVPQASSGLESGGLGTIGADTVQTPQGPVVLSTSWLGDASVASPAEVVATACHELGHNFGLEHARGADFGPEPLGPVGQLPAPWDQLRDYGDSFSNMGREMGQWAAPQKSALGWLQAGTDVATVEQNGAFVLQPYESAGAGLKAIRVRRGTGNDAWLWLEYRQPTAGSVDANLPSSAFTGALVHYEDAAWNDDQIHSNLLRFAPDSGLLFGNAPLPAGSSWTDPYTNLTLAVQKDAAGGLDVTVSYAPAATDPGALTPRASQVAAAGATVSLDVAASASYAWTAAASAPWITITAGASGTGNGRITLSVAPTTSTATRWGRVVVGTAVAVVTQAGLAGAVQIAPLSAAVPATGGTGTIAVSTNADDYAWDYTPDVAWIQSVFFSRFMSTGPGTLRYIVAQNTGTTARTGTIHIDGQVFTVTQAAGGPSVSPMTWTRITTTDAPISRHSMDMAAFTTRGESVFYGGSWDTTLFGDTWVWTGTDWLQKTPLHGPGLLAGHAMAYDASHDQVMLFGGSNPPGPSSPTGFSNSTWTWNGADWTPRAPAVNPEPRSGHAMVYNPVTKRMLLFGGLDGTGDRADTWEWDGTGWTERFSAVAPPARSDAAMAYDAARDEIVLFGGIAQQGGASPVFFNDTWVWDGQKWQQRTTATSPTPRTGARMEYNPQLGLIVLIGGAGGKDMSVTPPFNWVYDYREETWTWDGTNWTQRFPETQPEFSWTYGMVYDPVHQAFTAHLGDDLHCADRGPRSYVLTPDAGALLLDSYRAVVPVAGGSGSITVTGTVPWTATSDSWITLTGGAGNGSGTLGYTVAANPSMAARTGRIVLGNAVFTVAQAGLPPPSIVTPSSQAFVAGAGVQLAVAATGSTLAYQWSRNGQPVDGNATANAATLVFAAAAPETAGIYTCAVTDAIGGAAVSQPVVVGVLPLTGQRTAGAVTTQSDWQDLHAANGNTYDQFLLAGQAGTFTAGSGKVARLSFLDDRGSIVQVEMSGAGAVTVVLDSAGAPQAPTLYNQSGIQYAQGHATIIFAGADETSNLTIYSVGSQTNPGVTRSGVAYNGWAQIAAIGIVTRNGKFGGLHLGDVAFSAAAGATGLYAPDLAQISSSPFAIHDLAASGTATAYLYFAPAGQLGLKVAGGNLTQPGGGVVVVRGLAQVQMGAGQDSCGQAASARAMGGRLVDDGDSDLTNAIVQNP